MINVVGRTRFRISRSVLPPSRHFDQMQLVVLDLGQGDLAEKLRAEVFLEYVNSAFELVFVLIAGDLPLSQVNRLNQSLLFKPRD
jgi:hypothetical protein